MALTASERKEIETWTGRLTEDDAAEADLRLQDLGHTGPVAYEILATRYSDMLAHPDELRLEGDARVRWVLAKRTLQNHIGNFGNWWQSLDPAPVLNAEARALMAKVHASGGRPRVRTTSYIMANPRP